jgi:chromate reductase, NAD(P)H dehydrogenase (quinone)
MAITIGCIVGSTASASINRKLVAGIIGIEAGRGDTDDDAFEFVDIPIGDVPLYDYELDSEFPRTAATLKESVHRCDALLIATPEYNRSIPGALKNAIDWASRPYGESAFTGKPTGIVGASVGAPGTAMAQQHLRNILAYLDAPTLGQPEVFIQFTEDRFADDGTVIDEETRAFLDDWLTAYRAWIGRFVGARHA